MASEIEKYNRRLLRQSEKKAGELHYKKQVPIGELFEEDRKSLLMLPAKAFNVCRYEWLKADGYGKVCLDGKHFYSTMPENANQKVLVGIHAHTVDILTSEGQILTTHRRCYGEGRTDGFVGVNHYDKDGNKKGHSDPGFIGWNHYDK